MSASERELFKSSTLHTNQHGLLESFIGLTFDVGISGLLRQGKRVRGARGRFVMGRALGSPPGESLESPWARFGESLAGGLGARELQEPGSESGCARGVRGDFVGRGLTAPVDKREKAEVSSTSDAPPPSSRRTATKEDVVWFIAQLNRLREEVGKLIVGNRETIDGVLTCLLVGSNALLEGVPGLGKTLLVKTLSQALSLQFSRVQFTPDLMPADILGTTMIDEQSKALSFRKGPIFANIVLADEINRATPKTQSALLEAMQEHRVTVARQTYELQEPFFVLATQNPLESEGTYPLPEAQLDRFFFKLFVPLPGREDLHAILERTTGDEVTSIEPVLKRDQILTMQRLVRAVPVSRHVQDYAVRLVLGTHPQNAGSDMVKKLVRFGSSPRGAQALLLAAKVRCLLESRFSPSIDDIKAIALPALRHRVLLNFEGEAEGIKSDQVLTELLAKLPEGKE